MKIPIDREKRVILLKWLQQGYIEPLELPEAYKDANLFHTLLMQTSATDEEEEKQEQN